jgi:outer membrane receptor protein involved in Fe transport
MKPIYITAVLLLLSTLLPAQAPPLEGYVANENDELLTGALVYWEGTTQAVTTDIDGYFAIPRPDTTATLLIKYVGYNPSTIIVKPEDQDLYLTLSGITTLQDVEVVGEQRGNFVSILNTGYVEQITSRELKKAACCNLAESFETNASVDVGHSNAITGASEVQMLGLRGIYSQLLIENRPTYNGLAQPLSLELIPGTWIESIQISKGASSVVNGPQSITGQINTEIVKPFSDEPVFVNLFANHLGRVEGNFHLNKVWSEQLSTGFLFHASGMNQELDYNGDGFRDLPLKNQVNGMYRMFYNTKNLEGQLNVHAIRHRSEGGQMSRFDNPWLIQQDNDRLEISGKNGVVFKQAPFRSLGVIYNAYHHEYKGKYGRRDHTGRQQGAYVNLIYNHELANPYHNFSTGLSSNYDEIKETLFETNFDRRDVVQGAFLQYGYGKEMDPTHHTFSWQDNIGLIAGVRADYHHRYGTYITPRINVRINPTNRSVIRLSAGRGWRNPNFPPDWQGMMFGNRTLNVLEDLRPEDAWVYGVNYGRNLTIKDRPVNLVFDYFHTRFTNQIVMDMESSHTQILLYNLKGKAQSHSVLMMAIVEWTKGLESKVAWKYNDVRTTFLDGVETIPMIPAHRLLATVDYTTPNQAWRFNVTFQGVGSMRLPSHKGIPEDLLVGFSETSPAFLLVNSQVSWTRKKLDIYLGGENLGNLTQAMPILDAGNPDSPHFDANRIYAPILGTRIYAGLRYSFSLEVDHSGHGHD